MMQSQMNADWNDKLNSVETWVYDSLLLPCHFISDLTSHLLVLYEVANYIQFQFIMT